MIDSNRYGVLWAALNCDEVASSRAHHSDGCSKCVANRQLSAMMRDAAAEQVERIESGLVARGFELAAKEVSSAADPMSEFKRPLQEEDAG